MAGIVLHRAYRITGAIILGKTDEAADSAANRIDFVGRNTRVARAQDRRETLSRRRKARLNMPALSGARQTQVEGRPAQAMMRQTDKPVWRNRGPDQRFGVKRL